jgi:hypothetical protein
MPEVCLDEAALLSQDPEKTSRLAVYRSAFSARALQALLRYTLSEQTPAPLTGGFALARGKQGRIEHEVGPGAWNKPPPRAPVAQKSYRKTPEGFNRRSLW